MCLINAQPKLWKWCMSAWISSQKIRHYLKDFTAYRWDKYISHSPQGKVKSFHASPSRRRMLDFGNVKMTGYMKSPKQRWQTSTWNWASSIGLRWPTAGIWCINSWIKIKHKIKLAKRDPTAQKYKASVDWCYALMNWHTLSIRRRTHISQKLPKDYEDKLTIFQIFTIKMKKKHQYSLSQIGNVDQTPLTFNLLVTSGYKPIPQSIRKLQQSLHQDHGQPKEQIYSDVSVHRWWRVIAILRCV